MKWKPLFNFKRKGEHMKIEVNEQNMQRLLKRLRSQWDNPDFGLWNQYLRLLDGSVKEAQVDPKKFDRLCATMTRPVFEGAKSNVHDDTLYAVENLLNMLTPTQQKILRMTYWDGLSERQIAQILRIPRSTVNLWKQYALNS